MGAAARLLFEALDVEVDGVAIDRFVAAYLDDWNEGVVGVPRLEAWLDGMPQSKSVLTNTHQPDLVPQHLARLGVARHVAHVTSSVDHGRRKPDVSIYEAHLEALDLPRERVVFVGDNVDCDFHGPRTVGIEAYLISPERVRGVPEQFRLTHLFELRDRID